VIYNKGRLTICYRFLFCFSLDSCAVSQRKGIYGQTHNRTFDYYGVFCAQLSFRGTRVEIVLKKGKHKRFLHRSDFVGV
jgi:hypothetical protein